MLLLGLMISAVAFVGAQPAGAVGGTLSFDTGVVADSARIDDQFRFVGGSDGLRFAGLSADLGWPSETDCAGFGAGEYRPLLRKFTGSDTFSFYAHSGARGIESATNNCTSGEFGTGAILMRCTVRCLTLSGSMGIGNNTASPPVTTGDPTFTVSGYDAAGTLLQTVDVAITSPGALNDFTLDPPGSAAMTFVKLRSTGLQNTVIADDISYQPDPTAQPTVTVSSTTSGGPDVQLSPGAQATRTFSVVRGNGSTGTLTPQVTGLPTGVTAQLTPTSFSGVDDGTLTVVYSAASNAPPVAATPVSLSITADASAGTPNSVDFTVQVDSTLLPPAAPPNLVGPMCTRQARTITFFVRQGQSYSGPVHVSASTSSSGWSAGVLNDTVTASGGIAQATLLYTHTSSPFVGANIQVTAYPQSRPSDAVGRNLAVAGANPDVTDTVVTVTPPLGDRQPAVNLTANGYGFCAGDQLIFGNTEAKSPVTATQPPDNQLVATGETNRQALAAVTPRYATSGKLQVSAPGLGLVNLAPLQVRGFRNTRGFSFNNYPVNDLVYDDMTRAFGEDQTYMHIGPFLVRDPVAMFYTAIVRAETVGTSGSGHCYGIALTQGQFKNNRLSPLAFPPYSETDPWKLIGPDPGGPSPSLAQTIQANHLKQFGLTFLDYWLKQQFSNLVNTGPILLGRVQSAIQSHGGALITLADNGGGHAVLGYSVEVVSSNEYWIDLADSNYEHRPLEDSDTTGADHKARLDGSRIHVVGDHWYLTFPDGILWDGQVNGLIGGSITIIPFDEANKHQLLPSMLSIPQLLDLLIGFGSTSGSTTVTGGAGLASYAPDNETTSAGLFVGPPAGGAKATRAGDRTVTLSSSGKDTVTGLATSGGTAVLSSLSTKAGTDVTAETVDHGISLSTDKAVPLELQVAREAGRTTLRTTVAGTLPAKGELEVAQTKAGLVVDSTKDTQLTLTLASTTGAHVAATRVVKLHLPANKTAKVATSQLRGQGSTLTVTIGGQSVRLPVKGGALGTVQVDRVRVERHGKKVVVTTTVTAHGKGAGTVALTLTRNGKVVASTTRTIKAKAVRAGKPVTLRWKVKAPGHLKAIAQAALAPAIGTDGMVVSPAVAALG